MKKKTKKELRREAFEKSDLFQLFLMDHCRGCDYLAASLDLVCELKSHDYSVQDYIVAAKTLNDIMPAGLNDECNGLIVLEYFMCFWDEENRVPWWWRESYDDDNPKGDWEENAEKFLKHSYENPDKPVEFPEWRRGRLTQKAYEKSEEEK